MSKEDFIKELILKENNLKSFSEKIDLPYTTLITILKNSIGKASVDSAIRISKGLGTTLEGLDKMYVDYLAKLKGESVKDVPVEYLVKPNLNTFQVPYFGDIAAGALATVNAVIEDEVTYISIPEIFLGVSGSEELIAFKVNGESMNKIIPHGSTVVSKRISSANVKDGEIVIFSHDGQYSMKRFRRDEQDKVLIFSPESSNKKFRDTVVPYDTESDLRIYAKVIWYGVSI